MLLYFGYYRVAYTNEILYVTVWKSEIAYWAITQHYFEVMKGNGTGYVCIVTYSILFDLCVKVFLYIEYYPVAYMNAILYVTVWKSDTTYWAFMRHCLKVLYDTLI